MIFVLRETRTTVREWACCYLPLHAYNIVMVNSHSRASLIVVVVELQSLLVYKFVMVNSHSRASLVVVVVDST
jgi:hypothetical protein